MRDLIVYKPNNSAFIKLNRFFSKIIPKQNNCFNSLYVSIRRNNIIKKYKTMEKSTKEFEKFEEAYSLYIESLNDYLMNKIYKKVKYESANDYEKSILSNYYDILKLKETNYEEYRVRKQKYLLCLDYDNLKDESIKEKLKCVCLYKIKDLYAKLIENYIQNSDIEGITVLLEEWLNTAVIKELHGETERENEYIALNTDYDENDVLKRIQKYNFILYLIEEDFKELVSNESNNKVYLNIIEIINDWLNNNLKDKNFKEVYNVLIEIIKKYNSEDCDPKIIENDYLSQNKEKYKKLIKSLDSINNDNKKKSKSKKKKKEKKIINGYKIITIKLKNIKSEEIKNEKRKKRKATRKKK